VEAEVRIRESQERLLDKKALELEPEPEERYQLRHRHPFCHQRHLRFPRRFAPVVRVKLDHQAHQEIRAKMVKMETEARKDQLAKLPCAFQDHLRTHAWFACRDQLGQPAK